MYTHTNFQTKKALKEAVAAGVPVRCFQPGMMGGVAPCPQDGVVYLEGPHYPQPHKWYAKATLRDGIVQKVS